MRIRDVTTKSWSVISLQSEYNSNANLRGRNVIPEPKTNSSLCVKCEEWISESLPGSSQATISQYQGQEGGPTSDSFPDWKIPGWIIECIRVHFSLRLWWPSGLSVDWSGLSILKVGHQDFTGIKIDLWCCYLVSRISRDMEMEPGCICQNSGLSSAPLNAVLSDGGSGGDPVLSGPEADWGGGRHQPPGEEHDPEHLHHTFQRSHLYCWVLGQNCPNPCGHSVWFIMSKQHHLTFYWMIS